MKPKIIIADDHAFVRSGLVKILKAQGYDEILEAENGRIAVELFDANQADIVLLDMQMPEMDGLTACREIKGRSENVKVALLTMHEADDVRDNALAAGADEYMLKSQAPKRLPGLIVQFMGD